MHDGNSLTLTDAIMRHKGEAHEVTERFRRLTPKKKEALLTFSSRSDEDDKLPILRLIPLGGTG